MAKLPRIWPLGLLTACSSVTIMVSGACLGALCGCSSSGSSPGSGADAAAGSGGSGAQPDAAGTAGTPAVSGFDFSLKEGDFWEYGWKYHLDSFSASGSSNVTDQNYFTITLGAPTTIQGLTAFPLQFAGATHGGGQSFVEGHWTHVALAHEIFYGSSDGQTLKEVFNAQTGLVPGNGFFLPITSDLCKASPGAVSNPFVTDSNVWVLAESTDNSQCHYFSGVGTLCGNSGSSLSAKEYYKGGVGPFGYHSYSSLTSGSGLDSFSSSVQRDVGLIRSDLCTTGGCAAPQVHVQNARSASGTGTPPTLTISGFDPGSNPGRLLVVGMSFGASVPSGVTVSYGGRNLTRIPETVGTVGLADGGFSCNTQMWYLTEPSSTAADIVASWLPTGETAVIGAVAFFDVDQSTPVRNGTVDTGGGTRMSVTISSAPGDMTMDTNCNNMGGSKPTQTQEWLLNPNGVVDSAGSIGAGAASVTHSWTQSEAGAWVSSGIDIVANP